VLSFAIFWVLKVLLFNRIFHTTVARHRAHPGRGEEEEEQAGGR